MDRDRFVTIESDPWWLVERDVDYRIEEARKSLGELFGWLDPTWHSEPTRLEELYRFLDNDHRPLLEELDYATEVDGRVQWLTEVATARRPPAAEPSPAAEPPPPSARETEPEPAWDDGWQMLYRVNSSGAYEFALSDDQRTIRPGSDWMSQDQAHALRSHQAATAGGPAAVAEHAGAAQADQPTGMAEAIKELITELSGATGETGAQIAGELGLTEEELAHVAGHPDLERLVAEELAQLMSQQST